MFYFGGLDMNIFKRTLPKSNTETEFDNHLEQYTMKFIDMTDEQILEISHSLNSIKLPTTEKMAKYQALKNELIKRQLK